MWIVTYWIIQTFIIICPTSDPKPDEFGRTPVIHTELAISCTRTDSTFKYKIFYNKDSAVAFMDRGRADSAKYLMQPSPSFTYSDFGYDPGGRLAGFVLLHPYEYTNRK